MVKYGYDLVQMKWENMFPFVLFFCFLRWWAGMLHQQSLTEKVSLVVWLCKSCAKRGLITNLFFSSENHSYHSRESYIYDNGKGSCSWIHVTNILVFSSHQQESINKTVVFENEGGVEGRLEFFRKFIRFASLTLNIKASKNIECPNTSEIPKSWTSVKDS